MSLSEKELKYAVPQHSFPSVLLSLNSQLERDSSFESVYVHSLYFDTDNYDFAMEKAASDFYKNKVRVRFYSSKRDPYLSTPNEYYLELKSKEGSKRVKHRERIDCSNSSFFDIIKETNFITFINNKIKVIAPHLALNLKPQFFLSYKRERFTDTFSGSRIALDHDIIAKKWLYNNHHMINEYALEKNVLEVKGKSDQLPVNLNHLSYFDVRVDAFSKYYQCFIGLTGYDQ